jgi:hypothetical protein
MTRRTSGLCGALFSFTLEIKDWGAHLLERRLSGPLFWADDLRGVMEAKEILASHQIWAAAETGEFVSAHWSSKPSVEDGVRLMRAFLSIPQRAVRAAIIELVTAVSALDAKKVRSADKMNSGPLL